MEENKTKKYKGKPGRKRMPKNKVNRKPRAEKRKKKGKVQSVSFSKAPSMQETLSRNPLPGDANAQWESFVNLFKAAGPDLRAATGSSPYGGLLSETATDVIKVQCPVDTETFTGIAVSIISHAFNHGWRQILTNDDLGIYPYYAMLFIYNAVKSVAQGNQSDVPKVAFPDYLLEIMSAINPKVGVAVGAGTAGYSWQVENDSYVPATSFLYPSTGTQYGKMTFFVTTSNTYLGYNEMQSPAGTYTAELGAQAFSSLINFMTTKLVGTRNRYAPYAKRDFKLEGTLMERDNSAFANTSRVVGGGIQGGYAYSLLSNETPIISPKFSCFTKNSSLSRGFRYHRAGGGDSNYLVCSMLNQQNAKEVKNPNYPCFQPVDFYEFCDRLAKVVVQLFTLYYQDSTNLIKMPNLGMSPADFLIICRKLLMRNFSSTQYGVQSLRFYYNDNDDFIPLLCNSGGSSSANDVTMKLPLYIVENLNSLRPRVMYPNINPSTGKQIDYYPKIFIPVLGIYTAAVFDGKKYQYEGANGLVPIFDFSTNPNLNPVDCQLDQKFVDLDTSPYIAENISKWNNLMDFLSTYIQQPTNFTGDAGINVMTVVGDAFFVKEVQQSSNNNTAIVDKTKSKKDKKSAGVKKKKKVSSSEDEDDDSALTVEKVNVAVELKYVTTYMSQQVPIRDIVLIKKGFWLPEWKFYLNNSIAVGSVSVDTIRSLNIMPWVESIGAKYQASQDGDYVPMETLRNTFVSNCVKNKNADNNTIIKQMITLTEASRAGILGDLVGVFGGELVGGVIRTAASFIPV